MTILYYLIGVVITTLVFRKCIFTESKVPDESKGEEWVDSFVAGLLWVISIPFFILLQILKFLQNS